MIVDTYIVAGSGDPQHIIKLLEAANVAAQREFFKYQVVPDTKLWKSWLGHDVGPTDRSVMIIDAMMIPRCSGDTLYRLVNQILSNLTGHSIYYLATWGDKCQLYHNHRSVTSEYGIADTHAPRGFHCVLIPKSKLSVMRELKVESPEELTNIIHIGGCRAAIVLPRPFEIDMTKISHNDHYAFANPCVPLTVARAVTEQNNIPSGWVLILILFLVLLIIVVIKCSTCPTTCTPNTM
jgi:hypothetical protein